MELLVKYFLTLCVPNSLTYMDLLVKLELGYSLPMFHPYR